MKWLFIVIGCLVLIYLLDKLIWEIQKIIHHQKLAKLLKSGSTVLKGLINRIEKKKIRLASNSDFEFTRYSDKKENPEDALGPWITYFSKEKIVIFLPVKAIEKCLRENSNISLIELFPAHEIWHALKGPVKYFCPIQLKQNGCYFLELEAYAEGLKIIGEIIGGIENWQFCLDKSKKDFHVLYYFLKDCLIRQCPRCIFPIYLGQAYGPFGCPLAKEIWKTEDQLKEFLKISE